MRFLIIAATALLVTCRDATAPATRTGLSAVVMAAIAGTWQLQSIKDEPLPWTIGLGPTSRSEIVSASLTLNLDGTYRRATLYRETSNGVVSEDVRFLEGTFTGDTDAGPVTLRFSMRDPANPLLTIRATWTGTVANNVLTLSGFAEPWRFAR